ncbi:MAG: hypothetical protein IJ523_09425 [Succinivibrionaceae bacterium]|nr:hypothetical protein [Succinivibrionaceae bacterium]
MKTLKVGTGGSRLALIQTRMVTEKLKRAFSDIPEMKDCQIREAVISASGDQNAGQEFPATRNPGSLYREIHEAVVKGEVDFAVHSAEDVPAGEDPETRLLALLPREDPADMLLFRKGEKLKYPKIIGVSREHRRRMVSFKYSKANYLNLSDNVETHIEKLVSGQCDALLFASAKFKRLGLAEDPRFQYQRLNPKEYHSNCPGACQGIVALEIRRDSPLAKHLEPLIWTSAQVAMDTERKLMEFIGGDRLDDLGILAEISMCRQPERKVDYDTFMARYRKKAEQGKVKSPCDMAKLPFLEMGRPPETLDMSKPYVSICCRLRHEGRFILERPGCYYEDIQETIVKLALTCLLRENEENRVVPDAIRNRFALALKTASRAQKKMKESQDRLVKMSGLLNALNGIDPASLGPDIFCQSGKIGFMTIESLMETHFSNMHWTIGNEKAAYEIGRFIRCEYELMEKMRRKAIETDEDFLASEKTFQERKPKTPDEMRVHELMMAYGAYLTDRQRGAATLDMVARLSEEEARRLLEQPENG